MTPNRRRTVRWPDSLEGIPHGVLPRKALGGCILEIAREHPRDGRELGTFRHTDFSGKFGLCDFPLFDLILYPLPDSSRQIRLFHIRHPPQLSPSILHFPTKVKSNSVSCIFAIFLVVQL